MNRSGGALWSASGKVEENGPWSWSKRREALSGGTRPGFATPNQTPCMPIKAARGSAPVRILFAKDRLHETGGTLYYLHVLPRLDPARVTPLLCAFASRHPIAERFEAVGIKPRFFGRTKWDPRSVRDVLQFACGHHVDLVHLDGATSFPFGRLGARLTGLPTIAHFHSMLELPPVRALLNRQPMLSASRSIAVSAAVRQWAIAALAIAPERIEVFHNGHDIDRYASPSADAHSRIRREFALADNLPLVGVVGRLDVAQKGQDVMIRALPALQERCPGVALLLVGDGPDRGRCEALVDQLGLVDAVRFSGHRNDVPDLLAAVDIVAVPSACDEGLPLVAIEASAAGRPIVAFDGGGLPEVVVHGETGIIVPKGDVGRLSEAIASLLEDPELARRLGEAGRRHAARFGLSRHVSELTDFYEAVLDEHRQSKYRSSGGWREKSTC
jgi:glycosyltransferase involved in cell wall biosynthesis